MDPEAKQPEVSEVTGGPVEPVSEEQREEATAAVGLEKITQDFMCTPHHPWPKRRPSLTCLAAQTRRRTRSRTWSRRGLFVFFQYKVEYVHMRRQLTMAYS